MHKTQFLPTPDSQCTPTHTEKKGDGCFPPKIETSLSSPPSAAGEKRQKKKNHSHSLAKREKGAKQGRKGRERERKSGFLHEAALWKRSGEWRETLYHGKMRHCQPTLRRALKRSHSERSLFDIEMEGGIGSIPFVPPFHR